MKEQHVLAIRTLHVALQREKCPSCRANIRAKIAAVGSPTEEP